jgi:amino acid adenylation domain-containing protein
MAYLLSQLLTESADRFCDLPAVCCGNNFLSYSQLDALSGKIAAALHEAGIRTGDRVGIFMAKSAESVAVIFGILKAGAVYVPIDWFTPLERLEFVIENCGMKALATTTSGMAKILSENTLQKQIIPLCLIIDPQTDAPVGAQIAGAAISREVIERQSPIAPVTEGIIDKDLAYILYTSGSTGSPKGVMLSHLNALTFVNMAVDFFGITSKDRLINHAPLHFDLSVFDVFCAIKTGGCVVLLTETEIAFPVAVVNALQRHKITIWNSVPSALIQLVQRASLETSALSSLRLVLFAGELFPAKFLRALMLKIPQAAFYNMYGQTEANSSTWYRVDEAPKPDAPPLPIGKAFPNFDVFAIDDSGAPITNPGVRGELHIRGATVGLGYWRNAEKTSANFIANPLRQEHSEIVYKTGDIVTLDERGNYVYIGRNDAMIKCRGFRVDIGEIESTLYKFPGIAEAVVTPIPDEEIGNRLIGFIIPEMGVTVSSDDIKTFCFRKIPRYMAPEIFHICANFPRTSTGKVDRKALINNLSLNDAIKFTDEILHHA